MTNNASGLFHQLSDLRCTYFMLALTVLLCNSVCADEQWHKKIETFVQESCISCHDSGTDTQLDFTKLGKDLDDQDAYRHWVKIFDRVDRREMPPSGETQPSDETRAKVVASLKKGLVSANRKRRATAGRVPSRRLSRQEYEHTLHDLLGIGGKLAKFLPPENSSASFDVVASNQDISSVHIKGFLTAADRALEEAIQLGRKPRMHKREINYFKSPYIQMWVDREVRRGGGTVFKTDKDVVTFRGENFVFRSDVNGFRPPLAGNYRISVTAAAYQPRSSITVSLKRQNDQQGESELFAAWDLVGEDYREVKTIVYLRPDDYFDVSADELEPAPNGRIIYDQRSQPAETFKGEGVKIRKVYVEGPLETSWPPQRTVKLFAGAKWKKTKDKYGFMAIHTPDLDGAPIEQIRKMVKSLATKAFRRHVSDKEIEQLVSLAKPGLEKGRGFVDSARIPLRSILVSPELIFQSGKAGPLNDFDLASRLSYFLWRSMPDEELTLLANEGKLSDESVLVAQVDRMLKDPRSTRFVNEFLDQWLDLDQIDSTTPDVYLYPEYDDVLRRAMLAETREFFAHLIEKNLSIENLIDSDFTFLNRRLAEHYKIKGVVGEEMRKVDLGTNSVRGGILTHASIAKITANGTVTTPVKRGNFVLTNLLGMPPNPPPPNAGSIEPDTRGATTIRETLQRHQSVEQCAMCHRKIDPPGFALESFDPVGNYRTRYRNSKGVKRELNLGLRFLHKDYDLGRKVDTSGVTSDGHEFSDIRDYKKLLIESSDQVAKNVLCKLVEFSTGGEIEFADRDEIDKILTETRDNRYRLRSLIHKVVLSQLFRNR